MHIFADQSGKVFEGRTGTTTPPRVKMIWIRGPESKRARFVNRACTLHYNRIVLYMPFLFKKSINPFSDQLVSSGQLAGGEWMRRQTHIKSKQNRNARLNKAKQRIDRTLAARLGKIHQGLWHLYHIYEHGHSIRPVKKGCNLYKDGDVFFRDLFHTGS